MGCFPVHTWPLLGKLNIHLVSHLHRRVTLMTLSSAAHLSLVGKRCAEGRKLAFSSAYQLLQEDEMLKQLQFFSVASDGRVTLWTLAKSELLHQVLLLCCVSGDKFQQPGVTAAATAVTQTCPDLI